MNRRNILITISIIVLLLMIGFLTLSHQNNSQDSDAVKVAEINVSKNNSTLDANAVVTFFENDKVNLSLKSITNSDITFTITNQTKDTLYANSHSIALNHVMTPLLIMEEVSPNSSKDVTLDFKEYSSSCGIQTETDIKNITLDFQCLNGKEKVIISKDYTTIDLGDSNLLYKPNSKMKELYSENNFIISATDFQDSEEGNVQRVIGFFNNSETVMNIEVLKTSINKSDLDAFSSSEIYPGCVFYMPIITDKYSSSAIKSFSLEASCSDLEFNELFTASVNE